MHGTHTFGTTRAHRWEQRRTFAASATPPVADLLAHKGDQRLSVILPALNEAATIGDICTQIRTLGSLVDEVLVVDGGSRDGTARAAAAAGATVHDARALVPEVPYVGGKGESMWRSLAVATGDLVCWIDADIRSFAPHFVTRLVAPLLTDPSIAFVKGFYRRPLIQGDVIVADGGGRVTELLARPLLGALFPELGGFRQPLAGEYAGRRDVLEALPFFTGYSVEVGLLIDLLEVVGLDAMAQADLTERIHRNRPLAELAPMARQIAHTILQRARRDGRISAQPNAETSGDVNEVERPPMATLRRSGARGA